MKPISRHTIIPVALTLAAFVASCSDDTESTPLTSMFYAETPDLLVSSVDLQGRSAATVNDGAKFTMYYDNDCRTVDIAMYDIDLGQGSATYIFKDVPWEFSVGTPTVRRVVSAEALTSEASEGSVITITDVSFVYYEANDLDEHDCRGLAVSFKASGRDFTAYPRQLYCEGTTRVAADNGNHAILYSPAMAIDLGVGQGQTSVAIFNFPFDREHSGLTVMLGAATTVFTPGGYQISSPDVVVSDSLAVQDFRATATMTGELRAEYTAVTPTRSYEVTAQLLPNFFDTPTVYSGD